MISRDRVVSSTIGIIIAIFAVMNSLAFIIVILALIMGGLYEFFYMVKKKGIPIYSYTGIGIGMLIPLSTYMRFEPTKGWELLFLVIALLLVFLLQLGRNDNANAIVGISTTMFGVLYVSWLFSFSIKLRFLLPDWEGVKLVGFILVVTKCGDIGALLIGKMFGKHLLLPKVSPNKTVEGSIGSCLASMLAGILVASWLPPYLNFSTLHVAMMGAFFGTLGQLGDLSESLIKRDCNVKDSGKMLPALGGVLDTIDSLLFSVPAFYFYMSSVMNHL